MASSLLGTFLLLFLFIKLLYSFALSSALLSYYDFYKITAASWGKGRRKLLEDFFDEGS